MKTPHRPILATLILCASSTAFAGPCASVAAAMGTKEGKIHDALKTALTAAVGEVKSGFDMQMWGTLVNRDGLVCAVAYSGADRGAQWPGSRVISAQKANTANAFSLNGFAISTANLFSVTQPGGSLFGLQHSNPVNTDAAYGGNGAKFGAAGDPMVGKRIGGVNVFGGGLGIYNEKKEVVGGLGVSGDTSCADHEIAWNTRNKLNLDHLAGVGGPNAKADAARPDNIILDITGTPAASTSGFGHPGCPNVNAEVGKFPAVKP
jgi:uncharacterized protein GlcG (DUF336 family)